MSYHNYYYYSVYVAPTGPPQSLTVSVTSSTAALLQWAPPTNDLTNGVIQYYQIEFYNSDLDLLNKINVSQQTSYLLTDLHPFYIYSCTINAVTTGPGPSTTNITFQMFEDG